jgi:hypothetical protein
MDRLAKAWATRRARYGKAGAKKREVVSPIAWIPAEKRGRYDSLRNMHGAEMAREIIKLELQDASSAHS